MIKKQKRRGQKAAEQEVDQREWVVQQRQKIGSNSKPLSGSLSLFFVRLRLSRLLCTLHRLLVGHFSLYYLTRHRTRPPSRIASLTASSATVEAGR